MKKFFILTAYILTGFTALAQLHPEHKRTWNMFFGDPGTGFNYSTGTTVQIPWEAQSGGIPGGYSTSTISDTSGSLLIILSGGQLYDRNFDTLTPNCGNLWGEWQALKGAMILPVPDNDSLYIVFHTNGQQISGWFNTYYSIVNMNMNNGLGYVISQNNPLIMGSGSSVTAAYHKNAKDFWIVVADSIGFIHSWLLDNTLAMPHVCQMQLTTVKSLFNEHIAYIIPTFTTRPGADLIAISCGGVQYPNNSGVTSLLNFDNSTGCFSNEIVIESNFSPCYGTESCFPFPLSFSPQGNYVYIPFYECDWTGYRDGQIKRYTNLYGISSASDVVIDTVYISYPGQGCGPVTVQVTPVNTMLFFNLNCTTGTYQTPYVSQILYPDSSNPVVLVNSINTGMYSTAMPLNNIPSAWYYRPANYSGSPEYSNEPVFVFPNPADDIVYLSNIFQPVGSVVFHDMLGKKHKAEFHKSGEISVSHLTNGIYLLEVCFKSGAAKTVKLCVQHK